MAETPLEFILTTAGRDAMINAEHTGTQEIILDEVQFGLGQWNPTPSATALQQVKTTVDAVGGQNVGDGRIHITACDYSNLAYNIYEIGVFARIIKKDAAAEEPTEEKILFAICASGVDSEPILQKTSTAIAAIAFDVFIGDASTDNIVFGDTNFQNPPASTTVAGVAMIATKEEALLGMDGTKIITPASLLQVLSSKDSQFRELLEQLIKDTIQTEINDGSGGIAAGVKIEYLDKEPSDYNLLKPNILYAVRKGDYSNVGQLETNLISINYTEKKPTLEDLKVGEFVISQQGEYKDGRNYSN